MSGGVDVARGYDPNFPDSRGLQKDKVEMVGVDLENRFKTKSKGFEMPSASSIGGQLKKGLKPPEYFTRPKDEWDPLIIASLHGDISRVEDLLKREKRDVNVVTKRERYTALMAASGNGHSKVAKLLISHNAVHNLTTSAGVSALMMACHAGHYDTAKILLENGADPNKQDKDRYTALIYASINGFYRILELLLSHNADVNLKEWRQTALMAACYYGHYDVVELLIKNKAQINTQDINNFTALMYASGNNHYEVVKLLLDHNAKVNIENCYQGSTALSLACDQQRFAIAKLLIEKVKHTHNANKVLNFGLMAASNAGHYTLVKLLIENGAQVRCEDYLGNSPLSLACRQGHYEVTKLLLNRGAMHNVSILVRASYFGYFKIVKLLVKKGATVNMYDQGRVTALIAACTGGHYIIAELLLENDANPNLLDKFSGTSPLMIASSKGYYNLAKQLINKKAQLDLQSSDNFLSALMFASMQGHYSICKLLLRRGANMELLNKEERSALMLSANSEITRLLLDSGAKVDHQDYFGHTALSLAGDYDTTLLLLERGADVNLQAKDEETALVRSCRHGLYDVTKLLLDHGANPNIQDNIKFSPLHYAAKSGNVRVVKLLLNRGAEPSLRGGHGGTPLTLAQNVETLNLLIAKTDVQTKDLLIALNYAASTNNAPVLDYLYEKYPDIVGLQTDSTFPNIAFFKDKVEKWITPTKGAEIECSGLSISIPKGVTTEKADLPIIIRPCFGGPFELPADYVSASPAYLVQLQSREQVTINKDVTVRIHHYADLQTEEDCEDMVFLSASLAPHKDYRFEKINGVCGLFRAGDSVGEIKLRHFCLIKVARWVGRKLRRRHNRVSPGNIDRYSARLYRNMSPDAYSGVSAVFCVCLDHPLYIEYCDRQIRKYHAISDGNETADLSIQKGTMISDEIVVSTIPKAGWRVSFDKTPTKICRSDLQVDHVPFHRLKDYPPQILVYVRQTSIHENSDICVPELRVQGLDKGECNFQLMIPGRGSPLPTESSLQSSHQLQSSETSNSVREELSESESEERREAESLLTPRNVLTAVVTVASEWRNLGLALDVKQPTIDSIEAGHSDVNRCLEEVIKCWLNGNGGELSWSFLCEALKSPLVARPKVADDIEQKYININSVNTA